MIVIPGVPGFAGDLREDAAAGTRAIMDYQYKSINRGEHSIFGQISKAGFDPHQYVFVFNLRSYDRLNKTPALKKQEEASGVQYEEVMRANAEELMAGGNKAVQKDTTESDEDTKEEQISEEERKELADKKRRFEEKRADVGLAGDKEPNSVDSIAKNAMLGERKVSEEPWDDGDMEQETENFVQEELYIHAKLLIVDDRIAICGSSNINDRVSFILEIQMVSSNLFLVTTWIPRL